MKADAPKRKIFNDAVDLLSSGEQASEGNGVVMLDIDAIKPFQHHPFHLYEGERLDDMVESIRDHGVLNPVIVRKKENSYEMLSGHNRQVAAKRAGLRQIPAFVKEDLPDEEAYVYVIETNLMQRSFTDLTTSEKAAVLAERYDKVMSQGKRNDILQELIVLEGREVTCGHSDHKLKSRDGLGEEYGLSGSSVARLLRVNELIPEIKDMLDAGDIQLMAAVQLSYMPQEGQKLALKVSKESGVTITKDIAAKVRKASITEAAIKKAIVGPEPAPMTEEPVNKPKPIRLSGDLRAKYFADTDPKEVEDIVDKALAAWFSKGR